MVIHIWSTDPWNRGTGRRKYVTQRLKSAKSKKCEDLTNGVKLSGKSSSRPLSFQLLLIIGTPVIFFFGYSTKGLAQALLCHLPVNPRPADAHNKIGATEKPSQKFINFSTCTATPPGDSPKFRLQYVRRTFPGVTSHSAEIKSESNTWPIENWNKVFGQ